MSAIYALLASMLLAAATPAFAQQPPPEPAAAAGPVGRNANASTDAQMKAEIYSYSRSRGLFAGVAIDGAALRIDYDANEAVYGAGITPRRIFEGGVSNVPGPVVDFRDRLEEYTSR